MDATGTGSDVNSPVREQRDGISLEDLKLPATVAALTGLTGLFAAFLRRRAQVKEAEILERLQPDSVIYEEPDAAKLPDDQPANEPNEPTTAVRSIGALPLVTKAQVLDKWEMSLNSDENGRRYTNQPAGKSSFDSDEFEGNFELMLKNQSEAIVKRTRAVGLLCEVLKSGGIEPDRELVTILDLWIQAMNGPEYRTKWIKHINKFKKPEGKALKIFASHVFPELGDSFGSRSMLSRFFTTKAPITEDLLCGSLVPLGK
jgi:hypothetical protein